MSRSALWRQEGNVKERERQAEELFQLALEEGRNNRSKGLVPMWGPDDSFHFNPMLLQNIVKSQYFQKCCREIMDWNTLVDEIYYQVKHLEPWAVGSSKDPSTAFCLLLRLLTLRCTEKQMKLLLDHPDSPYIRAIGFLYLRYAGDPKVVWNWIEPYLYDEEQFHVSAASTKQHSVTMGDFVRRIFTERNHYGTIFPRLPIHIERDIQVKLLQAEKIEERAKKHASNSSTMEYFKKLGSKVMALYGDEENPVTWYEAVVDRVITTNPDTNQPYLKPKFVVTFPEYGNTETVTLGEMEMPGSALDAVVAPQPPQRGGFTERCYDNDTGRGGGGDRRREDDRGRGYGQNSDRGYGSRDGDRGYTAKNKDRGYGSQDRDRSYGDRGDGDNYGRGRDRDHRGDRWERGYGHGRGGAPPVPTEDSLYEEVRRREREAVTSNSRNAGSRRPPSNQASLMGHSADGRRTSKSPPPREGSRGCSDTSSSVPPPSGSDAPAPRKRSAEEIAAIQDKKRKLLAKYG